MGFWLVSAAGLSLRSDWLLGLGLVSNAGWGLRSRLGEAHGLLLSALEGRSLKVKHHIGHLVDESPERRRRHIVQRTGQVRREQGQAEDQRS